MIHQRRLDNGLTLLTEEMSQLRSAAVGVWLRRGSRHEHPEQNGISHFIEHLVFKGTERRSALEIARQIDAIGGQMDAFTTKESTCFYLRVLDAHLDLALDLLTDIVRHPRLDPDDIEKERGVIFEEIRMVEDSPEELLFDLLYEARWQGHPLGRPVQGTPETVAAMDRAALQGFFAGAYVPGNLVVSAAGCVDAEKVMASLAGTLEGLQPGATEPQGPPPSASSSSVAREKPDLEQVHVGIALDGLPEGHGDRHALMVLNNLLGGTMSSRLFQSVREEHGLAYSVYSGVNSYSDAGFQVIYAATRPDAVRQVVGLVGQELARLREEPVAEQELSDSRENLKGGLMLNLESATSRMSGMARREVVFGRQFGPDEVLAGLDRVGIDDIQRLSRELLAPERATLVTLGPGCGEPLPLAELQA